MHVYALLHRSAIALPLPEGVDAPLDGVVWEDVAAIVEPQLTLEALQADDVRLLQAVLAHDRVIRELFAQTTVLPLRFTSFPTEPDLLADLQANQHTYLATLERLQDKAEYVVKGLPREYVPPTLDATLKGRDYFLAKKQQYQSQTEYQIAQTQEWDVIRTAIAQHFAIVELPDTQQLCLLGDRHGQSQLQSEVQTLQSHLRTWDLQLGEPLPPFHFV